MSRLLHAFLALYVVELAVVAGFAVPVGGKPQNSPDHIAKKLPHFRRATSPGTEGSGIFTLPQIHNPRARNRTGLELLVRAFWKHGAPLTPELEHAVSVNKHLPEVVRRGTVRGTITATQAATIMSTSRQSRLAPRRRQFP